MNNKHMKFSKYLSMIREHGTYSEHELLECYSGSGWFDLNNSIPTPTAISAGLFVPKYNKLGIWETHITQLGMSLSKFINISKTNYDDSLITTTLGELIDCLGTRLGIYRRIEVFNILVNHRYLLMSAMGNFHLNKKYINNGTFSAIVIDGEWVTTVSREGFAQITNSIDDGVSYYNRFLNMLTNISHKLNPIAK